MAIYNEFQSKRQTMENNTENLESMDFALPENKLYTVVTIHTNPIMDPQCFHETVIMEKMHDINDNINEEFNNIAL